VKGGWAGKVQGKLFGVIKVVGRAGIKSPFSLLLGCFLELLSAAASARCCVRCVTGETVPSADSGHLPLFLCATGTTSIGVGWMG